MPCKDKYTMVGHIVKCFSLIAYSIGPNLTDIPSKSCLRLFIEEILSPFYVFQVGISLHSVPLISF